MALNGTAAVLVAKRQAMGPVGLGFLIVALAGAVLGGINAFTLASSKLIGALAEHRFLPRRPPRHTLRNAILVVLAISLATPWVGREVINYIVDMSSLLAAVAYL